jgi:hypothetical protein
LEQIVLESFLKSASDVASSAAAGSATVKGQIMEISSLGVVVAVEPILIVAVVYPSPRYSLVTLDRQQGDVN